MTSEQDFSELIDRFAKASEIVFDAIAKWIETNGPVFEKIYGLIWEMYRQEGCPYGETDEGLRMWITANSAEDR